MSYIKELTKTISGQVKELVCDVMKKERTDYEVRKEMLQNLPPTYTSPSVDDGRSALQPDSSESEILLNNNPEYWPNIIDRLNTPFDHIERIVLQDFSDLMFSDGRNLFKDGLTFEADGKSGFKGFQVDAGDDWCGTTSNFKKFNDTLSIRLNEPLGGFFVDSFTYTPFVDYSQVGDEIQGGGDERVGVYSDKFLTDYNTGVYDVMDSQIDRNRHILTSNLYELGNLKKDLEDAKDRFRDVVVEQDDKTYIYTFCEHLASLFAKLSNIRMCHEVYGFKHPHTQWEGILALDIWYQLLYKEIDEQYPFDDKYMNMNPHRKEGELVEWDSELWNAYKSNSNAIRNKRRENTTPREVLKKICRMVRGLDDMETKQEISDISSGDFAWFEQKGKVYSDFDGYTRFTRYTNLHLGRAYEVMTPREYCELMEQMLPLDGKYIKPDFTPDMRAEVLSRMVDGGFDALVDAFSVVQNEHILNIFNSNTNEVEEFDEDNAKFYSESQCAIVIERVFSRIYSYLQFKSTPQETYQRHINLDSGYKYLTTNSLKGSDHDLGIYYDPEDEVEGSKDYLRYLTKLKTYEDNEDVLDENERAVLKEFNKVLSKQTMDWLDKKWDLCPLLQEQAKSAREFAETPVAKMVFMSRPALYEEQEDNTIGPWDLFIDFSTTAYMTWEGGAQGNMQFPEGSAEWIPGSNVLHIHFSERTDKFDLSQLVVQKNPTFTLSGEGEEPTTVEYALVGFSKSRQDAGNDFPTASILTPEQFVNGGKTMTIYAAWTSDYIVRFSSDESSVTGVMPPMVVRSNVNTPVPYCRYEYSKEVDVFTYHNDLSLWQDTSRYDTEQVKTRRFGHWAYAIGGSTYKLYPGTTFSLPMAYNLNEAPVLTFTAMWERSVYKMMFTVYGKTYCEVAIDNHSNMVVVPEWDPEPTISNNMFMGWSIPEGSIIGGDESSPLTICGEDGEPIVCGAAKTPVVRGDDEIPVYDTDNEAVVVLVEDRQFNVAFKYIEDGIPKTREFTVPQNYRIPDFHIKNNYESDGHKFRFRYWLLDSGNITSSFTVLSDCVLVAVYDEVEEMDFAESDESDLVDDQQVESASSQLADSTTSFWWCEHLLEFPVDSSSSSLLDSSCSSIFNCGLCGLDPTASGPHFEELWECPYVKMLAHMYGKPTEKEVPNDFRQLSVIDIGDVETLLNALFKINLDIAHNEYFLKIDIPEASNWWYGYTTGSDIMCVGEGDEVVCGPEEPQPGDEVVCKRPSERYVYQSPNVFNWISFEPTVELKFSNFHAANQVQNNKLICTIGEYTLRRIVPVNREIWGFQYNDFHYFYDYKKTWIGTHKRQKSDGTLQQLYPELSDQQMMYNIDSLCLYENTPLQSPTSINDFIRHRLDAIGRTTSQVQTFTSIVKKYRPVIMPQVRDIFQDCQGQTLKYDCDEKNDYGVFGWCSIPSKTMVDMEYNEGALYVPSSYDHHNHVCGSNFMQMDADLQKIYIDPQTMADKASETWCWLYNNRDWTYFMQPFFSRRRNSEVYSDMLDLTGGTFPTTSNHINGVIFEQSFLDRDSDPKFGDMAATCEFLARHHHGENNLRTLSERYVNLISYRALQKLTMLDTNSDYDPDTFNGVYGSVYENLPDNPRFPLQDWIDDYDMTGSYVDYEILDSTGSEILKYKYNLGQSHAIDDFDEDSVWFYITMVEPIEEIDQAVQIEDIMPYVFWWDNRGAKNNGPEVDCYGLSSSAKLNYQEGGWCWSCAHERQDEDVYLDSTASEIHEPIVKEEQKWHAVAHTLGVDFSKEENGNAILTMDNSGNVYKGAFDPNYSGTDEKWKVHHPSNDFGTNQHEDPVADKYLMGQYSNGEVDLVAKVVPGNLNEPILNSMDGRQMVWNLWNVVRHYAYLKYFKNRNRELGSDVSTWTELESYTKKIVKGIYRTFKQNQWKDEGSGISSTFGDVDKIFTNYGNKCLVKWTNSFIEVTSILERNAREHQASLVLFTGDVPMPKSEEVEAEELRLADKYPGFDISEKMAIASLTYKQIMESTDSFRILSLAGMDASEDEDGIRTDSPVDSTDSDLHGYFNGSRYGDLPTAYVIGDSQTFQQCLVDTTQGFDTVVDLDQMYPFAEYHLNDTTNKWVRRIQCTVMNKQIIPVYTSMETMTENVHELTVEKMKGITFQVVPSLYWRYDWSCNDYMVHRVGKLAAPNQDLPMYDMLGNVWELVRDDWSDGHADSSRGESTDSSESTLVNHIVGTAQDDPAANKVIKGGAFNQFARNTISPAREGIGRKQNMSRDSENANVGFRPSMTFTGHSEGVPENVDLFFLFDASASNDSQIKKMVEQANEIVREYAGDDKHKDRCHVGSALFLGPTIHMMCAQKIHTMTQNAYYRVRTKTWGKGSGYIENRYGNGSYWTNSPYERGKDNTDGSIKPDRKDWINLGPDKYFNIASGWTNDTDYNLSRHMQRIGNGIGADGKPSGLYNKFVDFKKTWQDRQEDDVSERSPTPRRKLAMKSASSPMEEGIESMSFRADGGVTGGTTSGVPASINAYSGDWHYVYEYSAKTLTKTLDAFCGVPVYYTKDGLKYGQVSGKEYRKYSEDPESTGAGDVFNRKYSLFTYDISRDKADDYEWPFADNENGTLSNWWAGCEPVCDVLDKLIREGYFYARPWNKGQAFMFRKNVPRLVFVFSNEFDNSFSRVYKVYTENGYEFKESSINHIGIKNFELVSFPSTLDNNTLQFYINAGSELNNSQQPPDPHCLRLFRSPTLVDDMQVYLESIGFYGETTEMKSLQRLYNRWLGAVVDPQTHEITKQRIADYWLAGSKLNSKKTSVSWEVPIPYMSALDSSTTLKMEMLNWSGEYKTNNAQASTLKENIALSIADLDLNGFSSPLWGCSAKNLLTQGQQEFIQAGDFADFGYNIVETPRQRIDKIDYTIAKTIGYYRLKDVIAKTTDPTNVYVFVMNSDAPHPVNDIDGDDTRLFMYNDINMFKDMLKIELPLEIQTKIDEIITSMSEKGVTVKKLYEDCHSKTWTSEDKWDFGTLMVSNLQWILANKGNLENRYWTGKGTSTKPSTNTSSWVSKIPTIFGLENPYTSNNTIIAKRSEKISSILNKASSDGSRMYFLVGLPSGIKNDFGQMEDWRKSLLTSLSSKNPGFDIKVFDYIDLPNGRQNGKWWGQFLFDVAGYYDRGETPAEWSQELKQWVEKHIVYLPSGNPGEYWNSDNRRGFEYLHKNFLDQDNLEIIGVSVAPATKKIETTRSKLCLFRYFVSGESMIYREGSSSSLFKNNYFRNDNYIFSTEPTDMVTLEYGWFNQQGEKTVTGNLKIITREEDLFTGKGTGVGVIRPLDDVVLSLNGFSSGADANYDVASLYGQIAGQHLFDGSMAETRYPSAWKWEQYCIANKLTAAKAGVLIDNGFKLNGSTKYSLCYASIWKDAQIQNVLYSLYDDIQKSAPLQMAYRWQTQVFENMVDGNGIKVVDYVDKNSSVKMAAIPVQDVGRLSGIFSNTSTVVQSFSMPNSFSYNSCIIDLNPVRVPEAGKFPMEFSVSLREFNIDTYKKDKLLLTRVPDISGMKFDAFDMGSHSYDYNLIEDMETRKYRAAGSNPNASVDDFITVTLGNGGSYQKKQIDVEKNTDVEHDLYAIPMSTNWDERTTYKKDDCVRVYIGEIPVFYTSKCNDNCGHHPETRGDDYWERMYVFNELEKKYQRSKHFFIDPFELTIAQWCHIHEKHDVGSARDYLDDKIQEMRRSYWTYLSIWEKDEWEELKQHHQNGLTDNQGIVYSEDKIPDDDQEAIEWLILHDDDYELYNPLDDTRPYYYATYNEVRGTGQIYYKPKKPSDTEPEDWKWANYVIDSSNKGDEFQMNSRNNDTLETLSFMDILNRNVVYKTRPRTVTMDLIDGGEKISWDNTIIWCSGETAGINFDLPTEAQWEYCCRMGSTSALPPNYNLGDVFETNHPGLDLIAWYKYKVVGSLPEPERYCAWRISKMLFGIAKDTEQINNVYEPDPRSPVEGRTFNFAKMRGVIDATIATVNALGVGNIINPPI